MKRIVVFILAFFMLTVFTGCINLDAVVPTPSQSSEAPSVEPTIEPTISATEEVEEPSTEPTISDDDAALLACQNQKRPRSSNDWDDEHWDCYVKVAVQFEKDYIWFFEEDFGYEPDEEIIEVAEDFAREMCFALDDGATVEDIFAGIYEGTENSDSRRALALATFPGVWNFCPWNESLLD